MTFKLPKLKPKLVYAITFTLLFVTALYFLYFYFFQPYKNPSKPMLSQISNQTTPDSQSVTAADTDHADLNNFGFGEIAYLKQFPHHSIPIVDTFNSYIPLEPYEAAATDIEVDVEGNNVIVVVAVEKQDYFMGDTVRIRVQLLGANPNALYDVRAQIQNGLSTESSFIETRLTTETVTASEDAIEADIVLSGSIETGSITNLGSQFELLTDDVYVNVDISSDKLNVSLPVYIRLMGSQAGNVVGMGLITETEDSYSVPVELNLYQPGYYSSTAIVVDENRNPLLFLQNEERYEIGSATIQFLVDKAALSAVHSDGSLLLTHVTSERRNSQINPKENVTLKVKVNTPDYKLDLP